MFSKIIIFCTVLAAASAVGYGVGGRGVIAPIAAGPIGYGGHGAIGGRGIGGYGIGAPVGYAGHGAIVGGYGNGASIGYAGRGVIAGRGIGGYGVYGHY